MSRVVLFTVDLVLINAMVFGLYFPRHRRRDLLVAYLVVNLGVLAVTDVLATTTVLGAGLGLGLFGVLSIIRLRSSELDQAEVAYFFAALVLGLLAGLGGAGDGITVALMVVLLAALAVGDHPRLLRGYRAQTMTLDQAFTDESGLVAHLEGLLAAEVHQVRVRRVDLVDDTTTVEVRYRAVPTAVAVPSRPAQAVR
ncbi:MAG: DUF4956 domain-containing protein [Ilumatobacteraceae bacterium]